MPDAGSEQLCGATPGELLMRGALHEKGVVTGQ